MRAHILVLLVMSAFVFSCSDFTNNDDSGSNSGSQSGTNNGTGEIPKDFLKPNEGDFSEQKMLINIGTNVLAPQTEDFALQALALKRQVAQYCSALKNSSPKAANSLILAQEQWKQAMLSYHMVDAASIGPAQENKKKLAGSIYAWPFLNDCGIYEEAAELAQSQTPNTKIASNRHGLGAIEFILFDTQMASAKCNVKLYAALGEWNKKSTEEKILDRCQYAEQLSDDLVTDANELRKAWSVDQGNYTLKMATAPKIGDVVNELTNYMFSIEDVKDKKLGKLLGICATCAGLTNVAGAEHPLSGLALEAIAARLQGFKNVFFGGSNTKEKAFGFDDYLASKQHADISEHMEKALDVAIANAQTLAQKDTLQNYIGTLDKEKCSKATVNDSEANICAFYYQVREVAFIMETDVLTVLSLSAPAGVQGDND